MIKAFSFGLYFLLLTSAVIARGASPVESDICIYGGTSAAVTAAVQAARMGKSVVIVMPEKHLGGLTSGGLGLTDVGDKASVGGLSLEFYRRLADHYRDPAAWTWQPQPAAAAAPALTNPTRWTHEPHVAEAIFEDFMREQKIPVYRDEWLDRARGVKTNGARIESITTLSGRTYRAAMFIDATYEGDLMAAAGVDYTTGREANSVYGEQLNGVQLGARQHSHHFGKVATKISPYVVPGDPASGVLPRVSTNAPGETGSGDKKIQAYCFRLCLTDNPANRVAFPKPEGYDPLQYELQLRIFQAGWRETFNKFDRVPNAKTDVNNHGPFSTDNIGYNYDYPEASYERRREIIREHETYQKGWLYFIANDPRVPAEIQTRIRDWGLARDEFPDTGNWPFQLYVREARRMVADFVITEHEILKDKPTPDSVGMGSYTMDSHNVQRYIAPDGSVQNEGDVGVPTRGPYPISYRALVPKRSQCPNLVVPVCLSSSHIAYGSIRMEPVFMVLGQSAATIAALALEDHVAVQSLPYTKLRARLEKDGQALYLPANPSQPIAGLPNVLLIGDAVALGYAPVVAENLKGRANVRRIPQLGGTTQNGIEKLSGWLGSQKWDVICFNFGLYDVKIVAPGRSAITPTDYEKNLREIAARLQATGAKVIWCSTTPIPPGELRDARQFGDVPQYNRIAAKIMQENDIPVTDLHDAVKSRLAELQKPHDVYFLDKGNQVLAREVTSSIQARLPTPRTSSGGS